MSIRQWIRILWPLAGIAFTVWIAWGYQSAGLPATALESNAHVRIAETDSGWLFQPRGGARGPGLIFLPGGMVDPAAYTPMLKQVGASGHPAYLIRLPYRSAFLDSQVNSLFATISATIKANPDTRWYLGGHSRGAMLAARYARESQSPISGLILIGTTHPRDFDLSATPLKVTKILGANDGIASPAAARENAHLLPPSTLWIEIPGANHVQFGYYRHQLLDHAPAISREKQQTELVAAIRRGLNR